MEGFQQLIEGLRTVLELGWPAIVLIMMSVLWQAHQARTNELIRVLKLVAGVRDEGLVETSPKRMISEAKFTAYDAERSQAYQRLDPAAG